MGDFVISPKEYIIEDFSLFLKTKPKVVLSNKSINLIKNSRKILVNAVKNEATIYGVNTGFGKLSQVKIPENKISKLQENLILSHATGLGKPIKNNIVRLIILTKIISLSKGFSGIRIEVIQRLIDFLNYGCLPVIPSQGSVGASGDLAPLAHMTLPILGFSKLNYNDDILDSKEVLNNLKLKSIQLSYKEGLALINGTQFSLAHAIYAAIQSKKIIKHCDIIGAITVEALLGTDQAFLDEVHLLKPHKGQINSAKNIYNLLQNSEIKASHHNCGRVQDMYCIRCMPHVHGASRENLDYFYKVTENEINSVSDNPIILMNGKVISSGHFHAQAIGQAMDSAAIAITTLGAISERRNSALVNGDFGLPPFLVENAGLNSGFMITQITSAAIASENKSLSTPSTVDSIPTGAGQEDFVSMAPWAGRKLNIIISNVEKILSIELITAIQAMDFRNSLKSSPPLESVRKLVRSKIPKLVEDRLMEDDLQIAIELVRSGNIIVKVEDQLKLN